MTKYFGHLIQAPATTSERQRCYDVVSTSLQLRSNVVCQLGWGLFQVFHRQNHEKPMTRPENFLQNDILNLAFMFSEWPAITLQSSNFGELKHAPKLYRAVISSKVFS